MNKLKMWIIPILIVILALGGLIYLKGRPSPAQIKEPGAVTEEEGAGPKGFAKAPEPTPQQKAKLDSEAMLGALNSGKVSDCEKITWSEEIRKQCEDNINYAGILESGDEDQCKKLNDETLKMHCYNRLYMTQAVDSKDPSICEKITEASLKQMCLDQVQMIVSRFAKSAADCSVISSLTLRRQCEDNFYMQNSAKSLSVEGCNSISDQQLLAECKKTVTNNVQIVQQSKVAAQNASVSKTLREILALCDDLTGTKATTCKDSVYPQLAFDEKDLTYCDKISDSTVTSQCRKDQGDRINAYFLRQSLASNDKTLCNQILDAAVKQLCLNS